MDSFMAVQLTLVPEWIAARNKAQQLVFNAKSAVENEAAYNKWVNAFQPEKFKTGMIDDGIVYDYAISAVAQ